MTNNVSEELKNGTNPNGEGEAKDLGIINIGGNNTGTGNTGTGTGNTGTGTAILELELVTELEWQHWTWNCNTGTGTGNTGTGTVTLELELVTLELEWQ
jgi:hypothetical protein